MTNLALIVDQIKNEITVDAAGKGKASIRAVARLIDISAEAISKILRGDVNLAENKLAQTLAEHGFDAVNLSDWTVNGVPDIAIAVIAKYYAYKAGRYCRKQAELVDIAFTAIGVRAWIQDAVGWRKQQAPMTPIQALSVVVQQMAEQERKILKQEQEIIEQQQKLDATNARLEAVENEQGRYLSPNGIEPR